jgi:hypothetical protein
VSTWQKKGNDDYINIKVYFRAKISIKVDHFTMVEELIQLDDVIQNVHTHYEGVSKYMRRKRKNKDKDKHNY